ncbi:TetR/AcrR family transcriptional regulator [Salinimicrobium gaetbulicola]|uniref:TetR/AcrR family transcriptional regulator n=1 Tax=Salinimicrobium gaetbulicola TaxID=999702 RepID=A0ABW3IH15_9FLAO
MKEKILNKAAEKFLNLGVKSVTMDEIAGDLGMSKKTIYAHFSTKTKLVEATALHVFQKISEGIQAIREEKNDPIEEMYEIKNFACTHLRNERSSPQFQLKKYYPKIFETIRTKQQQVMEAQIKQNLERGMAAGIYRKDLPLSFTSRIYFVGLLGIKDLDLFPEGDYTTAELIEKHLEYHLRAIVTDKGRAKLNKLLNTNS